MLFKQNVFSYMYPTSTSILTLLLFNYCKITGAADIVIAKSFAAFVFANRKTKAYGI